MTALDLGTATRAIEQPTVAGTVTSVDFGSTTIPCLDPNDDVTPMDQVVAEAWSGGPLGYARGYDQGGADWYVSGISSPTPTRPWTAFVAVSNLDTADADYWVTAFKSGLVDFEIGSTGLELAQFQSDGNAENHPWAWSSAPTGLTVIAMGTRADGTYYIATEADGVVVSGSLTVPAGSTNVQSEIGYWASLNASNNVILHGVWEFSGTEADETTVTDTLAAIAATVSPGGDLATVDLEGTVAVTGEAEIYLSSALVPELPEPDDLTPGGTNTEPSEPALVIPADVPDPVIRRISQVYLAPTVNLLGMPVDWQAESQIAEEYARIQIIVEGVDVTWVNGIPTPMPRWRRVQPGGSFAATIDFPGLSVFHATPVWARNGANVAIKLVKINGDPPVRLFSGVVTKSGRLEDSGEVTLTCTGIVFTADLQVRRPRFTSTPKDAGHAIAEELNAVISRRFGTTSKVTTGVKAGIVGGWEYVFSGFVQTILSTLIVDGSQYTVNCVHRTPVIEPKDTSTIAWEIRAGQPGIDVDLEDDAAQSANILFGEWITPDGGRSRNAKYPNWKPDDTPAYPASPSTYFPIGSRDSDTSTGEGISVWEKKMGLPVDGKLSVSDITAMKRMQREAGIPDDGVLGPQTWATTFNTGANTGTLDGAWVAPLAFAKEVWPRLFGPDGDDLGPNPNYDPDVLPVMRYINFGEGVTRDQVRRDARSILKRDAGPGYQGQITFELDPPGLSRFELLEGQNGRVLDWNGEDVTVHVASVDIDAEAGTVSLDVDTRARDWAELEAIMDRDRAATDPARAALKRLTSGSLASGRANYDADSPAGTMPKHAIRGAGFWDVRPMPLGEYGNIVGLEMRTSGPARPFCVAVFGKQITADQLTSIVGNPLTGDLTEDPWSLGYDDLKKYALIASWGWQSQPLGYFPRVYTNVNGETSAPVTGRYEEEGSWPYASATPPWVWVATMATGPCYFEAEFAHMPGNW